MSAQLSLLSEVPASHRNDPSTSHEAEQAVTKSGKRANQQYQVRELVNRYPGRTSAELATLANLPRHMVARRLPELDPVHISRGKRRQCAVNHTNAITWWPKESNR